LAAVLYLPCSAIAQLTGNPAGLSPDTPGVNAAKPAADFANTQDKLFVREAALGGRAEIDLGKLAQQKSKTSSVKDFAKRMVDEHGKSSDQLLRLGKNRTELPDGLDPEHKTLRDELNAKPAAEFDQAYLTAQITDHQRTANLLLWELSYGQNEPLRKYAAEQLPVVLDHLEHAKREFSALSMAPPRN
jgi:putative membrane protein